MVAQTASPHITELGPAFEPNERHKNTLKTAKQQEENQMIDDNCVTSVPFLRRGRLEADQPRPTRRDSELDAPLIIPTFQPPHPAKHLHPSRPLPPLVFRPRV